MTVTKDFHWLVAVILQMPVTHFKRILFQLSNCPIKYFEGSERTLKHTSVKNLAAQV